MNQQTEQELSKSQRKQLNRYSTVNGKARKAERRAEAIAREVAASKIPLEKKLERLPRDGAKRQRARYTFLLAQQKERSGDIQKEKQERKKQRTQDAAQQMIQSQNG